MSKLESYKNTADIVMVAGLKQSNNGDFPLIEANAVQVDEDGKRLDEALNELKENGGGVALGLNVGVGEKSIQRELAIAYGPASVVLSSDSDSQTGLSEEELAEYPTNPETGEPFNWGLNSFCAGGDTNKAIGTYTINLGYNNTGLGACSTNIGAWHTTYSRGCINIGYANSAGNPDDEYYGHYNGLYGDRIQITLGTSCKAIGNQSIAMGSGTIAKGPYQLALGKYNIPDEESAVIIGNGYDDGTVEKARSNLMTISEAQIVYGDLDTTRAHENKLGGFVGIWNYSRTVDGVAVYDLFDVMIKLGELPRYLKKGDKITVSFIDISTNELVSYDTTINTVRFGDYTTYLGTGDAIRFTLPWNNDEEVLTNFRNSLKNVTTSQLSITFEGRRSLVIGPGHPIPASHQVIIGSYSEIDEDSLFTIGNGSSDSPANALAVRANGDIIIAGSILKNDGTSIIPEKLSQFTNDLPEFYNEPVGPTLVDPTSVQTASYGPYVLIQYNHGYIPSYLYGGISQAILSFSFIDADDSTKSESVSFNPILIEGLWYNVNNTAFDQMRFHFTDEVVWDTYFSDADKLSRVTDIKIEILHNSRLVTGPKQPTASEYQTIVGRRAAADSTKDSLFTVGNGTSKGASNALDVKDNGDIIVGGGIILTSPNGTKYSITVADDGTLTSTLVE